jgi:hypothetical protein
MYADLPIKKYSQYIYDYVGFVPKIDKVEMLSLKEWQDILGVRESIFYANTLGISRTTHDRKEEIYLKDGMDGVLVHELLHTAGFLPLDISEYLNEGFTQYTAERIGANYNIPIFKAYKRIVKYIDGTVRKVIPMPWEEFARKYAHARYKGPFFASVVWDANKQYFEPGKKWGNNPQERFYLSLSGVMGPWNRHINYLTDKIGVDYTKSFQ